MFIALDKQGNRVYAEDAVKSEVYHCQKCGKEVKPRQGKINRWHYAHIIDEECDYGKDGDYNNEWHTRMQEYFPKDSREYRFKDKETGEIHIADVFIKECNTVLEFQQSRIDEEEFLKRTWFHLNNGRRIAWLLYESIDKQINNQLGKFKFLEYRGANKHRKAWYKWKGKPRKQLINGPDIEYSNEFYSVCVYTGEELDVFRKVLNNTLEFDEVALGENKIVMNTADCIERMFDSEGYWKSLGLFRKNNVDFIELKKEQQIILKEVKCSKMYLLKENELKLGQMLYYKNKINKISKCTIIDFDILNKKLIIKINNTNKRYIVPLDYIGKTLYKSYNEAAMSNRQEE